MGSGRRLASAVDMVVHEPRPSRSVALFPDLDGLSEYVNWVVGHRAYWGGGEGGSDLPQARERSRQSGIDHHVVKPVALEDLVELISSRSRGGGGGG